MQIGGGQNRLKVSHFTNSHTLPKIAISLALLLGGANIAFAEESGGFVGIGVGYGDAKMIQEATNGDTNTTEKYKITANGASYGFVAGYKQFFNEYLGLRYYANVDLTHATFKITDIDGVTEKFSPILVNYGVNVDFLGNFVVTEIADFGGFIGLGIGGNSWVGKDMKDMKDSYNSEGTNIKIKDTSFDVALNVGLRTNIAKYHGIEIAVRVPFLNTQLYKISGVDENGVSGYDKQELGQNVRVLARYTFSF